MRAVVELSPLRGPHTVRFTQDVSSLLCGVSLVDVIVPRYLRPVNVVVFLFGVAIPTSVLHGLTWAKEGAGLFAYTYLGRPLWIDVWMCIGWWIAVGLMLLHSLSMQRNLFVLAATEPSCIWCVIMSGFAVAGNVSALYFGASRALWKDLPFFVGVGIVFPFIALSDALKPRFRIRLLRHFALLMLMISCTWAVLLRLPINKSTFGELQWIAAGKQTFSNLDALVYTFTVMFCTLIEGFLCAWRHPSRLFFVQGRIRISGRSIPPDSQASALAQAPAPPAVMEPGTGVDGEQLHEADWEARSPVGSALDDDALPTWAAEIVPVDGVRTFDVARDVASLVFGVSVADLAVRFRWPCIALAIVGGVAPIMVVFWAHWARGGWGEYALAYPRPYWNDLWQAAGVWATVPVLLLWFGSLQKDVAWLALKQPSTWWVTLMAAVFTAGDASHLTFALQRELWIDLPVYICCMLIFPLVAMADALPPGLRLPMLRFAGTGLMGLMAVMAVLPRLPSAADAPGCVLWAVLGVDMITNIQASAYSSTVLVALLAEGSAHAWMWPNQLAFIREPIELRLHEPPESGARPHVQVAPLHFNPAAAPPT